MIPEEIDEHMVQIYSYASMKKWAAEFKQARGNTKKKKKFSLKSSKNFGHEWTIWCNSPYGFVWQTSYYPVDS